MLKQMAAVSLSLALCLGLGGCGATNSSPASGSSSPANAQSSKAKLSKEDVLELLEHGKFTKAEEAAKSSNISKTERAQVLAYGAAKYIGSRSSAPSSMYEFLDCQISAFANSDLKLIDEIHDGFNSFISSVKNAYSDNYEKVEDLDSMCSSLADKVGETGYSTAIEIAKKNANQKNLVATTDASNIEQRLQEQPAFVSSSSYEVQDANLKSLYPDMLCFSVQNNTGKDMKNATVALAAWDCNNMPVVITDTTSIGNGDYIALVNCSDINLSNGQASPSNYGLRLRDPSISGVQIASFKAIVKDATFFDGSTWENPLYDAWSNIYENKRLQ